MDIMLLHRPLMIVSTATILVTRLSAVLAAASDGQQQPACYLCADVELERIMQAKFPMDVHQQDGTATANAQYLPRNKPACKAGNTSAWGLTPDQPKPGVYYCVTLEAHLETVGRAAILEGLTRSELEQEAGWIDPPDLGCKTATVNVTNVQTKKPETLQLDESVCLHDGPMQRINWAPHGLSRTFHGLVCLGFAGHASSSFHYFLRIV